MEVRQLMQYLRRNGCPDFGIIGTSYGGWVGALVTFLEREFRFVALLQPIADIEHAIWESPASSMIRKTLLSAGIQRGVTRRHAHLTSPLDGQPVCEGKRVLIIGGTYDSDHAALCTEKIGAGLAWVTIHSGRTRSLRLCRHA